MKLMKAKALFLPDGPSSEAGEIMARDDYGFRFTGWNDNGGDPDGNSWLLWPVDVEDPSEMRRISLVIRLGAEVVEGWISPYAATCTVEDEEGDEIEIDIRDEDLIGKWSGVQCAEEAFFCNKESAEKAMYFFDKSNEI